MTRNHLMPFARRLMKPHMLLGLAVTVLGALNLTLGFGPLYSSLLGLGLERAPVAGQLIASLGIGARPLLGVTLALLGLGLLTRARAAWVFAVVLLAATAAVQALHRHWLDAGVHAMLLGALVLWRGDFRRLSLLSAYLISLGGILSVLLYGTFGTYLLGSGFHPAITDLPTALYFTFITLSTVGYGDIVPVSLDARLFVISLILAGLSIFASAIISTFGPALARQVGRLFDVKGNPMQLRNHVILVGSGPMARNIARELAARKTDFVQIVVGSATDNEVPWPVVKGDASEDEVLVAAGIRHARLLIAAREDDGENAFIALATKALNPAIRVLAVASSAHAIHRLKLAHADVVFAPVAVGARILANLVEGDSIPKEFHDLLES